MICKSRSATPKPNHWQCWYEHWLCEKIFYMASMRFSRLYHEPWNSLKFYPQTSVYHWLAEQSNPKLTVWTVFPARNQSLHAAQKIPYLRFESSRTVCYWGTNQEVSDYYIKDPKILSSLCETVTKKQVRYLKHSPPNQCQPVQSPRLCLFPLRARSPDIDSSNWRWWWIHLHRKWLNLQGDGNLRIYN